MQALLGVIRVFIPESVEQKRDALRSAEFIVGFLLAITGCCFVYQLFYRQAGNPLGANLIVGEGLYAPALLLLLRSTGWVKLVTQLFFVSFVVLVSGLCLTMGGFSFVGLMPLLWGLTIPLAALLTLGQRAGLVWVFLVGGAITGIYAAHDAGVTADFPVMLAEGEHLFFVWVHIFGLGFMITALGLLFFSAQMTALVDSEKAKASPEAMAAQLETEKAGIEEKVRLATQEAEQRRSHLAHCVNTMLERTGHFAEGDLTVRLPEDVGGEMSQLAAGFNQATSSLEALVSDLSRTAAGALEAADRIDGSVQTVAARTEEQAHGMTAVSNTVETLTRQVLESAEHASQTAVLAERSSEIARQGGGVVEETLNKIRSIAEVVGESATTVEKLGRESAQIAEVVEVIDGIAARTHLLALNASIEAARAGEHGLGFAVVANEVRELADHTTRATREIGDTALGIREEADRAVESMSRGKDEVEEGMRLSDKAGDSLAQIVAETAKVVELVSRIAGASQTHAEATRDVTERIEGMTSAAGESARGVAEIARSAEEMRCLTDQLREHIGTFKVGES